MNMYGNSVQQLLKLVKRGATPKRIWRDVDYACVRHINMAAMSVILYWLPKERWVLSSGKLPHAFEHGNPPTVRCETLVSMEDMYRNNLEPIYDLVNRMRFLVANLAECYIPIPDYAVQELRYHARLRSQKS